MSYFIMGGGGLPSWKSFEFITRSNTVFVDVIEFPGFLAFAYYA